MSTIITIGHKKSRFEEIHNVLLKCGMTPAKRSKREEMTPQEINTAILRSHSGKQSTKDDKNITTGEPNINSRLWDVLALDLVLSNMEQDFWGWADSDTIYNFDFWKNIDSSNYFVLVYGEPSEMLSAQDGSDADNTLLEEQLNEWQEYNELLLSIYMNNQDRCILVHDKEVILSSEQYVNQVRNNLNAPIENELSEALVKDSLSVSEIATSQGNKVDDGLLALESLASESIVSQFPKLQTLYAQLQATANLPNSKAATAQENQLSLKAWNGLQALQLTQRTLSRTQEEADELRNELTTSNNRFTKGEDENKRLNNQIEELKSHHANTLNQLFQTQEQLEQSEKQRQTQIEQLEAQQQAQIAQLEVQKREQQEQLEQQAQQIRELTAKPVYHGAVSRVKSQLNYQLGAKVIQNGKSLHGWLFMPFALKKLARQVQEDKLKAYEDSLPPLSEYSDANQIEAVRQSLSYHLGNVVLANKSNPFKCFTLPFSLTIAIVKHLRKRKRLANNNQG